jgi:hypothetical protein
MTEYEPILRQEFAAEEGSFLLQLRCDLVWDQAAFLRLVGAMEQCARDHEGRQTIERWIAEGFWFCGQYIKNWSTHPSFPKPHGDTYYEEAYERLWDLSHWLFVGRSPFEGEPPWV